MKNFVLFFIIGYVIPWMIIGPMTFAPENAADRMAFSTLFSICICFGLLSGALITYLEGPRN